MQYSLAIGLLHFVLSSASDVVSFDGAAATSVFSSDSGNFDAVHALDAGSGYWCSSGGHGPSQVVVWTGRLDAVQTVTGIVANWAYSPNEIQILVSPDGSNFVEASGWHGASQNQASYKEFFMFDAPQKVRSVSLVMRGAREWGYFGLNSAAVLSESRSAMLVSGKTSTGEEQCLIAAGRSLSAGGCLSGIVSGTGNDVFRFNGDGTIESMGGGGCVAVNGAAMTVGLISCEAAGRGGEDSGVALTGAGQLKVGTSEMCVVLVGEGISVMPCDKAGRLDQAEDKFFAVAVEELRPVAAAVVRDAAKMALRSAARLTGTVNGLDKKLHELCGGTPSLLVKDESEKLMPSSPAGMLIDSLGVSGIAGIITNARAVISSARSLV